MIALWLSASLQLASPDCHDAAVHEREACALRAAADLEARIAGDVYCLPETDPDTRPGCFAERPVGQDLPEAAVRAADCVMAVPIERADVCAAYNVAIEEARMFRYLGIIERAIATGAVANVEENFVATRSASGLRASQGAWRAYVAAACDAFEEPEPIRAFVALGCRLRLTHERTFTLWTHYLSSPGECDPSAPEPTLTVIDERIGRRLQGETEPAPRTWCVATEAPSWLKSPGA